MGCVSGYSGFRIIRHFAFFEVFFCFSLTSPSCCKMLFFNWKEKLPVFLNDTPKIFFLVLFWVLAWSQLILDKKAFYLINFDQEIDFWFIFPAIYRISSWVFFFFLLFIFYFFFAVFISGCAIFCSFLVFPMFFPPQSFVFRKHRRPHVLIFIEFAIFRPQPLIAHTIVFVEKWNTLARRKRENMEGEVKMGGEEDKGREREKEKERKSK